jgi:hypothetical protein
MSENLDLVRSIYEAWVRGDFSSADLADPDIEYVIADGLQPGTWRGPRELAEGFRDFWTALRGTAFRRRSTASLTPTA